MMFNVGCVSPKLIMRTILKMQMIHTQYFFNYFGYQHIINFATQVHMFWVSSFFFEGPICKINLYLNCAIETTSEIIMRR